MRSCRLVAATAPRPRQPTHPADGASQAFRRLVNGLRPFTPLAVWRWLPRDSVGGARGGPRNTGGQAGPAGSALPAGEAPAPWDDRGQRRVTRRPPSGGKRRPACPSAPRPVLGQWLAPARNSLRPPSPPARSGQTAAPAHSAVSTEGVRSVGSDGSGLAVTHKPPMPAVPAPRGMKTRAGVDDGA